MVTEAQALNDECVILLHGLARTEASMRPLERVLEAEGYTVINEGYPSRHRSIRALAARFRFEIDSDAEVAAELGVVLKPARDVRVRVFERGGDRP